MLSRRFRLPMLLLVLLPLVISDTFATLPTAYRIEVMPTIGPSLGCGPNSNAIALNEQGHVVGISESVRNTSPCQYDAHAVIWHGISTATYDSIDVPKGPDRVVMSVLDTTGSAPPLVSATAAWTVVDGHGTNGHTIIEFDGPSGGSLLACSETCADVETAFDITGFYETEGEGVYTITVTHIGGGSPEGSTVELTAWSIAVVTSGNVDLGGIPPDEFGGAGKGINDNGDAAVGWGAIALSGGGGTAGAFFWKDGDGMSLITDGHSFPSGQAWGVNNSYEVAVSYRDKAYYWNPTEGLRPIAFFDTPDSNSFSWEINNSGLVVGASRRTTFSFLLHAFKYDSATDQITDLHDPDTVTYPDQSIAYGLNDDGDIVGMIEGPEGEYASIWLNGQARFNLPIPALGPNYLLSQAEHINVHHDVVGRDLSVAGEGSLAWVAFEVSPTNTTRVALIDYLSGQDAVDWTLSTAFEINDSRQIVGIGLYQGQTRGFLMTPIGPGWVPDGAYDSAPLRVDKDPVTEGVLDFSWQASCSVDAIDYAIVEGTIGSWTSHEPLTCTTSGLPSADMTVSDGNRYYLVVPLGTDVEGSYGRDSSRTERPAATVSPCRASQVIGGCP